MVKKAVIAAGGWSTRFLPAVKIFAKQMMPILDRPQIQRVMEELVGAGIDEIMVVHREGEESLRKYFEEDGELNGYLMTVNKEEVMDSWRKLKTKIKRLEFAPQLWSMPYGNGTPALVAKDFIGSDDFVYVYGDDMVIENKTGAFIAKLINIFEKEKASGVCSCQEVKKEEVCHYGIVAFEKSGVENQIERIVEKPKVGEAPSLMAVFGRFVFSPKLIEVLSRTEISRGELWLTDAINNLAKTDLVIAKPMSDGKWMTTGDTLNWLKVNLTLGLMDKKYREELLRLCRSVGE